MSSHGRRIRAGSGQRPGAPGDPVFLRVLLRPLRARARGARRGCGAGIRSGWAAHPRGRSAGGRGLHRRARPASDRRKAPPSDDHARGRSRGADRPGLAPRAGAVRRRSLCAPRQQADSSAQGGSAALHGKPPGADRGLLEGGGRPLPSQPWHEGCPQPPAGFRAAAGRGGSGPPRGGRFAAERRTSARRPIRS